MPIRSLNGVDMGIRSLNGLDNINPISATLPIEINDSVISLKGLNNIGSASQIIRVNTAGTQLEYHTLETVDLNSTQTLTNKTLSTGCSYTGNRIAKANLDTTLIDTTTGQTVQNKTLKNSSLNYNAGTNTLIGGINTDTYIDGTLNINSKTNQAIIRIANDNNHSIYIRKNLLNVDNTMAFYSYKNIEYYTGNGTDIDQASYPKRLSISNTEIISTLEFISNDIKTRNIYLRENTASNGDNYINIKAPASLSTNYTLNVKAENGTIALITDLPTVPTISATNPMTISNNVIKLANLTDFGSSGQVITTNGSNAFSYTTLNNISSNDVIQFIQNASQISNYTGSGLDTDPTTIGNGSGANPRNTNINGKDIILNSSTTNTKLQIGGADKVILTTSLLLSKTKLLVSATKTTIDSSSMFEVSSSGLSKLLINSEGSSGDCELAFQLLNGSTTHSGHIYYRNSDRHLDIESFEQINFSYTSGGNQLQKYQFSLSTLTLDPTTTMNLKINNSTKLALTSTLSTLSGDKVRLSNGSGNTRLEIQNALTYSVNPVLISSASTSLDSIAPNLEVQQTGAVCKFLVSSSNNIAQIYLKSGSNFSSLEFTSTAERFFTSGMRIIDFLIWNGSNNNSKFVIDNDNTTVSNRLRVQYDDINSFVELDSNVNNAKIGLHMINTNASPNGESKLFYDFGSNYLVYESPTADSTGQRFKINGQAPAIVDANGRGLIFRTNTGNYQGIQVGNGVDNTRINAGNHILVDTPLDMNFKKVRFKDQGDDNHYIHHTTFDSIDGPAVGGWEGVGVFTRYGLAYRAKNDGTTPKLCAPNGMSCNSDDRIKFNEVPVINAIDTIKKLRPVYYNKASELDYIGITSSLPNEYGFIAQDTYNNVPELRQSVIFNKNLPRNFVDENLNNHCVEDIYNQTTDSDGKVNTYRDICGFNYDNLHAINVKAIQELVLEIELLKNRINQLELASS